MAHGAPDYWRAMVASKSLYAPNQAFWHEYKSDIVASAGNSDLVNYTVPAGKTLLVAGGFVSAWGGHAHSVWISIGVITHFLSYFETALPFPFNPDAPLEVMPTYTIILNVTNLDECNIAFSGGLYGSLLEGA